MEYIVGLIFVILFISSVIIEIQNKQRPSKENEKNKKRLISWWGIAIVCMVPAYGGFWLVKLFSLFVGVYCMYEFTNIYRRKWGYKKFTISVLLTMAVLSSTLFLPIGYVYVGVFSVFSLYLICFCFWRKDLTEKTVFLFIAVASSAVSYLADIMTPNEFSKAFLVLLSLNGINDVGQYISGKIFGKKKLCPSLSPSKTVEGAVGGVLITAALSAFVFNYFFGFRPFPNSVLIGLGIAILGIAGDLSFSYYKRQAGVKDSGTLLPGHGGLIDRVDSLLFSGTGFFLASYFLF